MSDIAIKVEELSKLYKIGVSKKGSIQETFKNLFSNNKTLEKETDFWALKDVSFEIKKGEAVGFIGKNGAGKSTLLKILSRITEPTNGKIEINGRVSSLLEVGTGFHPELSGRENIFLNGTILGMKRAEIREKFDEIVAFSGIEKFIDTPVKRYSSGMYVRLAFAVAAHLEPEILIIDEVLAVGDAEFQKKCLGKMEDVSRNDGRTILFVSHNMGAVGTLCNKGILMEQGQVKTSGNISKAIESYMSANNSFSGKKIWNMDESPGDETIRLLAVKTISNEQITENVPIDKEVTIEIEFLNLKEGAKIMTSIHLLDNMGNFVLATANMSSATSNKDQWYSRPHPKGKFKTYCKIPANFLNEGKYSINVVILTDINNPHVHEKDTIGFTVIDTGEMRKDFTGTWIGVVRPKMEWNTTLIN